jgi:altronate hydrolase
MMARVLRLAAEDNVLVAIDALAPGGPAGDMIAAEAVPAGHKLAARPIAAGEPIIKYGVAIGEATAAIPRGGHVHVHNVRFMPAAGSFCGHPEQGSAGRQPVAALPGFRGFVRTDGRVGTRNSIAIVTSVNCSATVAQQIAAHFTTERLADWPHVDSVDCYAHASGCGMAADGQGIDQLRRTLAGIASHPNVGGALVVGLGCEVNQPSGMGLPDRPGIAHLVIQEAGGTRAAIAAGIEAVEQLLDRANAARRTPCPPSALVIGLQCGGSDGYSGLSANPALGRAVDRLVAAGGTAILSETPEIFGAEHLLLARAARPEVAIKLREKIAWWQCHAARSGASLNANPSPGNIAGGITTIVEKSLGAVAKAGSAPLTGVLDYAEPVRMPGLLFMDSPGYDPVSATGQIAGGANLICFTTGRGAVFGSRPAPTLKFSSTTRLAEAMPDDIDVDLGPVLEGEPLDQAADRIVLAILAAAGGRPTASEKNGLGAFEFLPWVPGATF